jgi:hypothetical protein
LLSQRKKLRVGRIGKLGVSLTISAQEIILMEAEPAPLARIGIWHRPTSNPRNVKSNVRASTNPPRQRNNTLNFDAMLSLRSSRSVTAALKPFVLAKTAKAVVPQAARYASLPPPAHLLEPQ